MERAVLAFSHSETAEKIRIMLEGSGLDTIAVCHSKSELLRVLADIDEALVIMGYKLPDAVADEVMEDLGSRHRLMCIVRADRKNEIYNQDIFVIALPVNRQILHNAIETYIGIIERQRHRKGRTPKEKRVIEDAKAYLMENHMMTEEQAHRFIQKRSMDTGTRFIDTARAILNR